MTTFVKFLKFFVKSDQNGLRTIPFGCTCTYISYISWNPKINRNASTVKLVLGGPKLGGHELQ